MSRNGVLEEGHKRAETCGEPFGKSRENGQKEDGGTWGRKGTELCLRRGESQRKCGFGAGRADSTNLKRKAPRRATSWKGNKEGTTHT